MNPSKALGLFLLLFAVIFTADTGSAAVRKIQTSQRLVALTFDDGPQPPFTEQVLAVLAGKKVKATFFLIGEQIEAHSGTARAILANGHEVGGHSCDWELLAFKRRTQVEAKLDRMKGSLASVGVTNLALFRPPYGLLLRGQQAILEGRGLRNILADVVVGDWMDKTPKQIEDAVLRKVRPGSIIVLHDGGGDRTATVAALGGIIDGLREQGYTLLTVSELLACAEN